ncbi:MAG: amino acid permease [Acidobacteria bacterium]|nr:amino acid permease [Acidobacteriota bacterium]
MAAAELPRKLGLLDAATIVVGGVIGTGIFLVPAQIAQRLPSAGLILAVWIFTGVLSLFGALAFAELGAMIPSTGGQYVYLRESWGPLTAFLCGWTFFLVIQTGLFAGLASGFAIYLSYFVPLTPLSSKLVALALIAVLTFVNYRGARAGATVQDVFTLLSVAGLAAFIAIAFFGRQQVKIIWSPERFSGSDFGVAMIGCLLAYEGWNTISMVAGEVRQPQRNLPLALGLGMAVVIALYLLANLAYLRVLSIGEITVAERVASTAAERAAGPLGAILVSVTILLSIIGCSNSSPLTAPRVYFAQARDGLFFSRFGQVHPRFETPGFSVLVHGLWSAILVLTGSYQTLISYTMVAAWIFYGLTVAGVLILRRTRPELLRPYKMWGYPLTPVLFVAISLWFVINAMVTTPVPSLAGLGLIATGIPIYYIWRRV